MKINKNILLLLMAGILVATSACGSAATEEATPTLEPVDITSVAETAQAQVFGTLTQLASMATATGTPTLAFTGTPLPSATSNLPMISVSKETNCRTGPDTVYDRVGGLVPGVMAVVTALDPTKSYYYIENPNYTGSYCWVWGYYATRFGDFSGLPIYQPGPTPTPGTPAATSSTITITATGPTATSTGYICSLDSQTPVNGTTFKPNQQYKDLTWVISNDGSSAWAASEVSIKFASGTNLHTADTFVVPATAAGATATMLLDLVIPGTAGEYSEVWNVMKGSTTMCTLGFSIKVAP